MEDSQRDWETLLVLEESLARWLVQGSALAYHGNPWSPMETQSEEEEEEEDEDIPAVSYQIVEVWNVEGGETFCYINILNIEGSLLLGENFVIWKA